MIAGAFRDVAWRGRGVVALCSGDCGPIAWRQPGSPVLLRKLPRPARPFLVTPAQSSRCRATAPRPRCVSASQAPRSFEVGESSEALRLSSRSTAPRGLPGPMRGDWIAPSRRRRAAWDAAAS